MDAREALVARAVHPHWLFVPMLETCPVCYVSEDDMQTESDAESDAPPVCPACGESTNDGAIFDHPACRDGRCFRCCRSPVATFRPFQGVGQRLGE